MKNEKQPITKNNRIKHNDILMHIQKACEKIAPLWSLENFVAVNPFMGLSGLTFTEAAKLLSKTGGIQMTLPVSFYLKALKEGTISREDIEKALASDDKWGNLPANKFLKQIKREEKSPLPPDKVNLCADIAAQKTGFDWSSFMIERITSWASSYFDQGQLLWKTSPKKQHIFTSWKIEGAADATPFIMGLKTFSQAMRNLPDDPYLAARESIRGLQIPREGLDIYLHTLLQRAGGWSAYNAGLDWDSRLYGGNREHLSHFLAVLLSWEYSFFQSLENAEVRRQWEKEVQLLPGYQRSRKSDPQLQHQLILQQAFDHANQRQTIDKINTQAKKKRRISPPPLAQAIFCIDVRSEIYRRNLELVSSRIQTMGFAGFFAFPVKYIPIGHESGLNQCPALIPTQATVMETIPVKALHQKALKKRIVSHQVGKAWKSFKKGAVSCFSFMGPMGLSYLPKMYSDAFAFTRPVPHPASEAMGKKIHDQRDISLEPGRYGKHQVGIILQDQIHMAHSALRAMSLTSNFSRLVLIAGHGSTSVNNPHATGLDCGACGGHTGEANARLAVRVLNNPDVRKGLAKQGIVIPRETHFIAALHDTTTDEVALFNEKETPESHRNDVTELKKWLALAGKASRTERATRLQTERGKKSEKAILKRSKDWSQVRPEWGLAGCNTFVVAPRERTSHLDLGGKSFLHSYNWQSDEDFEILELIMTAPMIVTSWINLQYYASVVDNQHFGSGNKTLHNITGGIGVLEGYSGDLRVGLPWQSVHDGIQFQHLPQRLNVIIEAPLEAMNAVLKKHTMVQNLCDNGWINLLAMNEQGQVAHIYQGNLRWEAINKRKKEELVA